MSKKVKILNGLSVVGKTLNIASEVLVQAVPIVDQFTKNNPTANIKSLLELSINVVEKVGVKEELKVKVVCDLVRIILQNEASLGKQSADSKVAKNMDGDIELCLQELKRMMNKEVADGVSEDELSGENAEAIANVNALIEAM